MTEIPEKVGVLLASYGDIDEPGQLEAYFKRAFTSFLPPFFGPLKNVLAELVWILRRKKLTEDYERFGFKTNSLEHSRQQADKVATQLQEAGHDVKTYIGFTFAKPYIATTLQEIQKDGITKLIVINQGAAYSLETTERDFEAVESYLAQHSEWNVIAIGVKSFAENERFVKLLVDGVQENLDRHFPGVSPEDTVIFLPIHGITVSETQKDDYIPQCMYLVAAIRERFTSAGYSIPYGFQNHPFLFTQWTQPPADSVATKIGRGSRQHVLIYGRISFTIDNSETLGDQNCEQRGIIEEESDNAIAVAFTPMFNDDDGFADCMKALIIEVLQGGGDIKYLG
ncbi:MAG: ferrochelatase [Spirulina sp.]